MPVPSQRTICFAAAAECRRPSVLKISFARPRTSVQETAMSFDRSLADTIQTFESLTRIRAEIDRASDLVVNTLRAGKKLLICGNGGSAAEAQHFSTELVGRYFKNRRSLPAIALSADGSLVTCIGNDYGFEHAFARQIEGLAQPGDLVIGITSSGNSPDILAALEKARQLGLQSISFLGRGGGKARGLATVDLIVPGDSGRTAQEAHLFLIHHFCDRIDAEFE
jgi:D-sedoheptulose 7-phosphate isomerase